MTGQVVFHIALYTRSHTNESLYAVRSGGGDPSHLLRTKHTHSPTRTLAGFSFPVQCDGGQRGAPVAAEDGQRDAEQEGGHVVAKGRAAGT